jgi:FAD/FMN-containing dehydrogenase
VYLDVAWSGSRGAGEAALAPLRALATPVVDDVRWKPYPDLFPVRDAEAAPTWGVSSRSMFLESLDDAMIDVILRRLTEPGAPGALVQLRILGGAMARIPADSAAFGWRDRSAVAWIITPYEDLEHAAAHEAWTATFRSELPADDDATYLNFMGSEGADAVRTAYPAPAWARLRELKRRYDPDNVFRSNHNIPPG